MLTLVSTDPIQQNENGVYFVRAYFTNSNGDELNTGLPVSGASATQDEINSAIAVYESMNT